MSAAHNSITGSAGIPAGEGVDFHHAGKDAENPSGGAFRPRRSAGFLQPALLTVCPCRAVLCLILLAMATFTVHAHDPGLSTATVRLQTRKLEAVLVFSVRDVAVLVDLDKDRDGELSKEELAEGAAELQKTVGQALEVKFDGEPAKASDARCRFDESDNASVYLSFPVRSFSNLVVRSTWLKRLPPGHRQFFSLENPNGEVLAERMLSATADTVTVQMDGAGTQPELAKNSFVDFLVLGVKHIWTGYDHLLFLFGLLIVTRNFVSSLKIITCFTIAHSLTLAVATLSLVQISSRIVEPLIAASIVYVGVENLLRGDDPKGRWLLTFAFGLIHGFGFASVLRELGVGANGSGITVPLVSFNLGVELGQIAVAALALPVIWKLRTNPVFIYRWVPACSFLVVLLGGYWFVQRVWL
jgi:hydrogenase/urease accessory protein HupE